MPTLRSRAVVTHISPSVGVASTVSATPNKTPSAGSACPLSTLITVAASSLDPVTPAGDQEHSLPPISPRPQQQTGGARRRKGVEKKLQFAEQHHGAEESTGRRSKRLHVGEGGEAVRRTEVVAVIAETMDNKPVVDKGKRKVVADSGEVEYNDERIDVDTSSDAEVEIETNGSSLQDENVGTSHNSSRDGEGSGGGKRRRSSRASTRPSSVNVDSHIAATVDGALNLAAQMQEDGPALGTSQSNRRGVPLANAMEATKAKFLEIARRRAAHFAHFTGEDEPTVPAASGRSVDEQKSRAAELLAQVSAGAGRVDDGEQGEWPGPFIVARQLVEGRAAAAVARHESSRIAGAKLDPSVKWFPSRQPCFAKYRVATSLHDMCVEVLCANIEHVQSLVGVPESTKKCIASRLCAQRKMTPIAVRLYFESEPAQIVVPDCTSVTEENLTEAVACCPTQQLEVLELGMCGRCLTDQLCATALAGFASSLPILNTLVLKGAYRFTDNGLTTLLRAAPNLITLKLDHCNMISEAALQAVADSLGPKLKALSLESCSQLDALQILPSLLKMSSLQSLCLSGISGMNDGIISELAVVLGPNLLELSIADSRGLTDAAIKAVSLCCSSLRLLDLSQTPLLTDVAIGSLADGCRSLRSLWLNRGKFSDTALAALVTASGHCLCELSLNSVRQVGDYTLSALARHSKGTLEQLDLSFCRTMSDQALGLLADSCSGLREIRLFGCTQITNLFLDGHSNSELKVIGLQDANSNVKGLLGKATRTRKMVHQDKSVVFPSQVCL